MQAGLVAALTLLTLPVGPRNVLAQGDLAGCYAVDGPAGAPVVHIRRDGDRWRGDFQGAGDARLGVPLAADLHSTRVVLETNGPFMAVRRAFTVAESLTGRTDILARLEKPLAPPDDPDTAPAPFLWWAFDDDMLLAWQVPCGD